MTHICLLCDVITSKIFGKFFKYFLNHDLKINIKSLWLYITILLYKKVNYDWSCDYVIFKAFQLI
jgi:hypothetical protein